MLNRIFVVDSVTLTSTGTAVSSYVPWDQSTRKLPTQVVIKATGQGAYVRLSNDNSAATNADVLVQGGDHVVLSVQGRRWVSVLSDGASSTVNVGALSTGVSGSAASLDLPFTGVSTLDSRITFTRASSATFTGSNGLIQSATTNTPRFDYDPVTLAAKGLLIEEQRTNIALYSETHSGSSLGVAAGTTPPTIASATYNGVPVEAITFAAGVTGYAVSRRAGSASPQAGFWTQTNGVTYTASCYVALSRTLAAGEVISIYQTGVQSDWSITIDSSTQNQTTLKRYSSTATANISGSQGTYVYSGGIALTSPITVYITYFQVEAGSFATSYIPTVASQVTRAADSAVVNTLSPWFNQNQGTFSADADTLYSNAADAATIRAVFAADDGTYNNLHRIYQYTNKYGGNTVSAGVNQSDIVLSAVAANTPAKTAYAYAVNDFSAAMNGVLGTPDTSGTLPSPTRLSFGVLWPVNGHIRRITYYPRRLSNAELQAITA